MPLKRLKDFFLPAWKHSDPGVRQRAVLNLPAHQHEQLETIILTDESPAVRLAAVDKLQSPERWQALLAKNPPEDVRQVLTRLMHARWRDDALACKGREQAAPVLARITDEDMLAEVAIHAQAPEVRLLAIERIAGEPVLCRIAEQPCGKEPGEAAVNKITDRQLLERLVTHGANKRVRRLATDRMERFSEMENQPSPEEQRQRQLEGLISEAEKLSESYNWEFAERRLKQIEVEMRTLLDSDTDARRATLKAALQHFAERHAEFLEREEQERREAAVRQAAMEQREALCQQMEALASLVSAETEEQEAQVMEAWAGLADALPEEVIKPLEQRLQNARKTLTAARKAIVTEQKQLSALEEVVTRAENLAAEARGDRAEADFQALLRRAEGMRFSRCDPAPLQSRLEQARDSFRQAQQAWRETHEADLAERRARTATLLERFQAIFTEPDWRHAAGLMRDLNQEWRDLDISGMEPAYVKECAAQVQAHNNQFGKWLEQKRGEEEWERWANLGMKEELITQVAALATEENAHELAEAVKAAQAKWKSIGPVPRENADEIWGRFQTLCNEHFARAKAHFDAVDKERLENQEKKEALVARAEILQDSTDWKATTDELKGLQEEWKAIGPAPRDQEQELYHRFRRICDAFFERLREHHEVVDQERLKHLERKEAICARAEELSSSTNWWETINEISDLHTQWKQAGPAPRSKEDLVWNRFQAATQAFFDRLEAARPGHLVEKQALLDEATKIVQEADDPVKDKDVAEHLKQLQAKWKVIGPGPQAEERELWKAFQKTCDAFFEARREHFEELIEERESKLKEKHALVERARQAAALEDKREAAEQLKVLQQEWKEIGAVPFREDAELWQEFRGICNEFFEERGEAFEQRKQNLHENLRSKEALIARLEILAGQNSSSADADKPATLTASPSSLSVADQLRLAFEENFILGGSDDPREQRNTAFEEVKKIQADWREIGPVPRKVEQTIWQRYRQALDAFYNQRRENS